MQGVATSAESGIGPPMEREMEGADLRCLLLPVRDSIERLDDMTTPGFTCKWCMHSWWRRNGEGKVGISVVEVRLARRVIRVIFLELGKRHALVGWT